MLTNMTTRHVSQMKSSRVPRAIIWGMLGMCLLAWETSTASAQRMVQQLPPNLTDGEALPETPAIPSQVQSMPEINAELEVVHRRSQVIVFKSKIARVHVTDPSVADYVLYSPKEMGVIGSAIGTTTILIWFEDEPEADPLIYLVTVVRDPGLDEAMRIDYGKLEKKIAIMFPNSKVYLIPMSSKIIVKGQARDSEEASWILQLIRGEVINQMGALAGPQFGGGVPWANNGGYGDYGGGYGGGYGGYGGRGLAGVGGGYGGGRVGDWISSNIINMMTIPGDFQINLRVRIVELNRSQLRRMGVDLRGVIANGRHILSAGLIGATSGGTAGAGAGTIQGVFEAGDANVIISALRANGTARILTEPNLTVLSGHSATVLSGGEFAVPTIVGIGGVGGQQTVFRGFGVSLLITPTIIDKDMIRMRIRPEYSEINSSNASGGIPGLNTRRVDTTVQLREGQTMVLAGLLSYRARTEVAGLPFLGGLPVIGPLAFQAKRATEDETELLIMVSPEIVRPMEADEVPPVPGFEVTQPDDKMLFHYGFTQGNSDTNVYQLAPYGQGSGTGVPIGYGQFNPQPASPMYSPAPGGPGAGGGGYAPGWDGQQTSRYPTPAPQAGRPTAPQTGYAPPQGRTSAQVSPQRTRTIPQGLRGSNAGPQSQTIQTGYAAPQGGRYR